MSMFKPAFDKFSSKAFVLPINEYEFAIGTPKTKTVDIKNGERAGQKMYIMSFPLKVVSDTNGDTEYANKIVTVDFIINTDQDDAFNRVLKVAMAANGIVPGTDDADNEFRSRFGNDDWSVNFETNTLGSAWTMLNTKRFVSQMKIGGKAGYERNELAGLPRPI